MRYLAIDYGKKRTGLAICDPTETFTSPLAVLQGQKRIIEQILEIIDLQQVSALVIGIPLNMDGSKGFQAKEVENFAKSLEKNTSLPIYFQDERLTTFAAEQKIIDAQYTNKKKKKRLDAIAAAEILNNFLENKKEGSQ